MQWMGSSFIRCIVVRMVGQPGVRRTSRLHLDVNLQTMKTSPPLSLGELSSPSGSYCVPVGNISFMAATCALTEDATWCR